MEHQNYHWRPALFTDENRFTQSTGDRCERVWRSHGDRYVVCNKVQHEGFDHGSLMVWGGVDLYMISGDMVRPYTGASLGSSW